MTYARAVADLNVLATTRWYAVTNRTEAVVYRDRERRFHFIERLTNGKEHVPERDFARRIVQFLKKAHEEGRFDDLVLVAEPHFLGLLRYALPAELAGLVSFEIHKEFSRGSDAEIRERVLREIRRESGLE